jgi:hypothetical protein
MTFLPSPPGIINGPPHLAPPSLMIFFSCHVTLSLQTIFFYQLIQKKNKEEKMLRKFSPKEHIF